MSNKIFENLLKGIAVLRSACNEQIREINATPEGRLKKDYPNFEEINKLLKAADLVIKPIKELEALTKTQNLIDAFKGSAQDVVSSELATKFMKKPIAIEAVRFMGIIYNKGTTLPLDKFKSFPVFNRLAPVWVIEGFLNETLRIEDAVENEIAISVKTLEGSISCTVGNWLLKGVRGELYPCEDSIFCETYFGVE